MNEIYQSAKGVLRWAVVDAATGQVVKESDWFNNLILNAGMDSVAARSWVSNMLQCAIGTGITPVADDSGVTVASQSGTTVTLSGGSYTFDTVNDVGAVIKWDTGETAQIVSFNSAASAEVANSATVVAGEFTLYHTAQIGLATEVKRTNNYLTGAPNCATTVVGSQLRHRRTYDFTAEVGTVNYTEAGFGWAAGPNNLFSRVLFPAPVQVLAGQQLRVVYELRVTVGPTTPNVTSAVVGGWPIAPAVGTTGQEQMVGYGMDLVNSSNGGNTTSFGGNILEPGVSTLQGAFIGISNAALPSWPSDQDYNSQATTASLVNQPYVAGSYTRDKTATFSVAQANRTDLRSMGLGVNNPPTVPAGNVSIVFLFDEAQTKLNTHTLTLTWRFTWSRDLS